MLNAITRKNALENVKDVIHEKKIEGISTPIFEEAEFYKGSRYILLTKSFIPHKWPLNVRSCRGCWSQRRVLKSNVILHSSSVWCPDTQQFDDFLLLLLCCKDCSEIHHDFLNQYLIKINGKTMKELNFCDKSLYRTLLFYYF